MTLPVMVSKEERRMTREPFDGGFGLMRRFSREMDRLFGDLGFRPWVFMPPATEYGWSPEIEVFERKGQFVVRADLPGLTKDNVKVNVENDMLTIEGERKQEAETSREGFYRSERSYGTFYRSLPLPEGVKTDQITATFKDGVLEVLMPLAVVEKKVKKVDVKAA